MLLDNLQQDVKCNDLQLAINRENGGLLQAQQEVKRIWKGMIQRGFYHEENSRECHHHWQFCKERRMRLL